MKILVLNAGSSSLKYQFINMENHEVIAKGLCEKIGLATSGFEQEVVGKPELKKQPVFKDHSQAIAMVMDALTDPEYGAIRDLKEIDAIGHRILHGGDQLIRSSLVDEKVKQAIADNIKFGPLHNPAQLKVIEACTELLGDRVPQVVVLDTAFHQTMPKENFMYGIPYEYYEKDHIRRYGFHGTSHRYITKRASQILNIPEDQLNIISCHLGNGSSLAAVKQGKCYNTTMGLTPLAGMLMGTRSGNIDPAIVIYLMKEYGFSPDEMDTLLNKKSGVLGISGVSSDFRDLGEGAAAGNERCQLALDMFHTAVRRYIGAYAVELGRIDAITFTGGIGENGAEDREAICRHLEMIGAQLDPAKNNVRKPKEKEISTDDSAVKIWVIPTNEELMIALDTEEIVHQLG